MMGTTMLAPTKTKPSIKKQWTQVEFHQLPEGPPYYELEEGELIEMARPRMRRQKLIGKLFAVISAFIEQNKLGGIWPEVEVDITPTKTYVPDLSFLATGHLDKIEDGLRIVGSPDLVIEVLSPSTADRDKSKKVKTYQQAGVPWCWLVEYDSLLIYEYKNTPGGYLLTEIVAPAEEFSPNLFSGLTFNLAELMGELADEQIVEESQNE